MKRTISIILAACIMLSCCALLGGCQKAGSSDYPVTLGDVTIDKEPKNIVVLNDELADIISYIGYDIKMVGRSSECDQDYLYVVPIMGAAAAPDINAITAAGTDLVVADSTLTANAKSALEEANIKVLTLDPPTTEDELHTLYVNLGTALGGNETGAAKGENGYSSLFSMLSTLNKATSAVVQTAAYLYLDGSGQLCTFVKGSLEYKIFSYNGCTNVFLNQQTPVISASDLRVGSPKYIFYDTPETLAAVQADPEFAKVDAIFNGHTLQIPIKQFRRHGTTAEKTVFTMLDYIEKLSKTTPDEAENTAVSEAAAETPTAAETAAETEAASAVAEAAADVVSAEANSELYANGAAY